MVYAEKTYMILPEGVPDDRFHQDVMERITNVCSDTPYDRFMWSCRRRSSSGPAWRWKWCELPMFWVAASFRLMKTVRDHTETYSALAIAWFQNDVEPLLAPEMRPLLEAVDWAALAVDYSD